MKPDVAASGTGSGSAGGDKPGTQSASRLGSGDTVTDGPIIDLKAKRIADPAQPKSGGGNGTSGPTPKVGAPPEPATRNSGPALGTIAATGLIGGVIGAGLLFGLTQLGGGGDEARLAAIDHKIATLAPREALGALDKRVASNEQAAKAASERASEALQKATGQAAPAASEGATPAPQSGQADLVARLDALDQRVSALQEEPGREQPADPKTTTAPAAAADVPQLAGLAERLKALESRAQAAPSGAPDIAQKLAALQGDVKASDLASKSLGERLDQFQKSVDARVKSATEAVQSVTEASRKAAEAEKARDEETARGFGQKLQEQGERLAALDKAVDGAAKTATVQAALRIVAADRIATALASGAPYTDALSSLRNTEGGDAGKLEALAPYAETGAPTAASLATAFRPIRETILSAQRAAKAKSLAETGSVTDRLQAMAASIVQVRPSTSVPPEAGKPAASDEDPTAAVQDALDRGRVAAAQQAFAALKEDLRAQAGEFGRTLKARADADAAAQSLQAEAFRSLSAPGIPAPVR